MADDDYTRERVVEALPVFGASLTHFDVSVDAEMPLSFWTMARIFDAAGVMGRLRELTLATEGVFLNEQVATALAAACPGVTRLCISGCPLFGAGFGSGLAVDRGALPALADLDFRLVRGMFALWLEFGALVAHRRLTSLRVSASEGLAHPGLVDAILGCAAFPATLDIGGLPVPTADTLRLLRDGRAAVECVALELPPLTLSPTAVAALGPLPRLRRLRIEATSPPHPSRLRVRPWTGLPALVNLSLCLRGTRAAFTRSRLPALTWLLRSLAESPCRATLRALSVGGSFYVGAAGAAPFGVLASFPVLASLSVSVELQAAAEAGDALPVDPREGAAGAQAMPAIPRSCYTDVERELVALLPRVLVNLQWWHSC
ncbi:hypothetical protein BU14_0031s0098 [Porphyra umbilicalis]|uniref:F-box domain-containing protein n=1 Tax=Porphyra umbilicalis TaxID=2786 RepID=A0A1X6PJ68_PORUM|nr:hypothetical protein BU14_0031s0098 [Porphyra umbilicalis]|eukprot:OSX80929.1 hypothetical protein BU14_0031s0098 [Porphyra umbilicalis]